jgi:hypothetical protein
MLRIASCKIRRCPFYVSKGPNGSVFKKTQQARKQVTL